MAERKGKASPAAASVAAGAPTGRWAEVLHETREKGRAIEPFEITETLVLSPPTPDRSVRMSRATLAAQAAIKAAANAAQAGASPDEVKAIRDAMESADDEYTKALVGDDKYDEVVEYFADRPEWQREAFYDALKVQFLRMPSEDELTYTDQLEKVINRLLEALSKVDPENPLVAEIGGATSGKGNESSTTSATTGTSSRETSPDTSTGSEPETGASTGPGANSSTTPTP